MKPIQHSIFVIMLSMCEFYALAVKAQKDQPFDAFWQPGYIIRQDEHDTLRGLIAIQIVEMGRIKEVKFKMDENAKELDFKDNHKSDLAFFGTTKKKYRVVNWTDELIPTKGLQEHPSLYSWVSLEEEGAINLSLGFYLKGAKGGGGSGVMTYPVTMPGPFGTTSTRIVSYGVGKKGKEIYIPVYCLKKGQRPLALIIGKSDSQVVQEDALSYKLNDRYKDYFMSLISDDPGLVKKIEMDLPALRFYNVLKIVQEYNERAKKSN